MQAATFSADIFISRKRELWLPRGVHFDLRSHPSRAAMACMTFWPWHKSEKTIDLRIDSTVCFKPSMR